MKRIFIPYFISLLCSLSSIAQRASQFNINDILAKIDRPAGNSHDNYIKCDTTHSTGCSWCYCKERTIVNIKDAGQNFLEMQALIDQYAKDCITALGTTDGGITQDQANALANEAKKLDPEKIKNMTPAQIQQLQRQMMNAAGMNNTGRNMKEDPASLKKLGLIQKEGIALQQTLGELKGKFNKASGDLNIRLSSVQLEKKCPEDKSGAQCSYCSCEKGRAAAYDGNRIKETDKYVTEVNTLLQAYLPRIKASLTIIDLNIGALNYGDLLHSTSSKKLLLGEQQKAYGAVNDITAISADVITNSGREYANLVSDESAVCEK